YLQADTTLAGSGTVIVQGVRGLYGYYPADISGAPGVRLTIGPAQTVRTEVALIGMDVVNQGQLQATGDSYGLTTVYGSLDNGGVLGAVGQGANLLVNGPTTSTGTIRPSAGGGISLAGGFTKAGSVDLTAGGGLGLGGKVVWDENITVPAGGKLSFDRATYD